MSFDRIIGQKRAKEILQRAIRHNRVAHAYLFSGPEGVGKEALAIEFARALFCQNEGEKPCGQCSSCRRVGSFSHPDFIYIFPMPKSATVEEEKAILESLMAEPYARKKLWAAPVISIDRVRQLRHISTMRPLEGRRVVVIAEAEQMTMEAANSLLKILEEPPESMYLILTTSRPSALLPTIISRCQEIRLGLLSDADIERELIARKQMSSEIAKLISRIAQGSYRHALEWVDEDLETQREYVLNILRTVFKDFLTQMELIEELNKVFDKRGIKEILSLILLWLRDALVLWNETNGTGDPHQQIVNIDRLDTLKKFVSAFESIDFDQAFKEMEKSIERINRNVQLNLILIVLFLTLRKVLKIKGEK